MINGAILKEKDNLLPGETLPNQGQLDIPVSEVRKQILIWTIP